MADLDTLNAAEIGRRLRSKSEVTYDVAPEALGDTVREAAVLVPFVRVDDAWQLLFIRRARQQGDRHSGQVAFAGGQREAQDVSLEHTALRETEEEIGVAASDIELLGHISHHHTVSDFVVRPYVGVVKWPYRLELDPVEVARAFTIPLNWLADSSNYRLEERLHPDSKRPWPVVYYQHYDGELLWGATARMTLSLIELLKQEN